MAYCVKCGTQVNNDAKFCPQCGEPIPQTEGKSKAEETQEDTYYQGNNGTGAEYTRQQTEYTGEQSAYTGQQAYHREEYFSQEDVGRNKAMGVLSYLGILFVIPLIASDKTSEYVRHHLNQGIMLFIISNIVDLLDGHWVFGLHAWIHFGESSLSWILDIANFACFVMMIVGIVYACQGKKTEIPVIGKVKIWK